jgi:hypothetical protein
LGVKWSDEIDQWFKVAAQRCLNGILLPNKCRPAKIRPMSIRSDIATNSGGSEGYGFWGHGVVAASRSHSLLSSSR